MPDRDVLIARARAMRREPTDAEARVWRLLRGREFEGLKFRRQVPVGDYIVDFVCFEARLIIECDGGQHVDSAYDERRDAWLRSQGFQVLRFWNGDVLLETEGIGFSILAALGRS